MTILVGDCRAVLATLDAASVDAVVTDPPYEIRFMGKRWDETGVAFDPATWEAVARVMKPGAHLLAFGGTRTFHRMTVAIEDAGFEIKDCLSWLHGQGFPKHKSLLKPAWEPIILARKRGAGLLNIDACRIEWDADSLAKDTIRRQTPRTDIRGGAYGKAAGARPGEYVGEAASPSGRWPANVCLDETAAALLDEQSGIRTSNSGKPFKRNNSTNHDRYNCYGKYANNESSGFYGDTGGASRFFFCAKASRSERNAGLAGMPKRAARRHGDTGPSDNAKPNGQTALVEANHHPTVKPIALMRWLVRLVTPPDGLVLDPFAGSGSTGVACAHEGFRFLGIEQSDEYAEIARRRIGAVNPLFAMAAN